MNTHSFTYSPPEGTGYRVSLLVDDKNTWIFPWAKMLLDLLSPHHEVSLHQDFRQIAPGDVCFFLGYLTRVPPDILKRNRHNLVIHESDLPQGRGWSPVAWQVSSGVNDIPVCVFEATDELDAGPVYLRDTIALDGTELLPEIREKQGRKTVELCLRVLEQWEKLEAEIQDGPPSYYRRRTAEDDRLDIKKSIEANFNHLRILDNENYPGWFDYKNCRYIIKIYKENNA
ncbi:MAG: formyltransferase family protein [Candidatus Omnitrophota bacterium]